MLINRFNGISSFGKGSVLAVIGEIRGINSFDVVAAICPVAQVDHFTSFAAKRTKGVIVPGCGLPAGWTLDCQWFFLFLHARPCDDNRLDLVSYMNSSGL